MTLISTSQSALAPPLPPSVALWRGEVALTSSSAAAAAALAVHGCVVTVSTTTTTTTSGRAGGGAVVTDGRRLHTDPVNRRRHTHRPHPRCLHTHANQSASNLVPRVATLTLAAARARAAAISRYLPPHVDAAYWLSIDRWCAASRGIDRQTDTRTDGRTPHRYLDAYRISHYAASVNNSIVPIRSRSRESSRNLKMCSQHINWPEQVCIKTWQLQTRRVHCSCQT